jgi:predicted enzyme related to lactoylglutathione lyase
MKNTCDFEILIWSRYAPELIAFWNIVLGIEFVADGSNYIGVYNNIGFRIIHHTMHEPTLKLLFVLHIAGLGQLEKRILDAGGSIMEKSNDNGVEYMIVQDPSGNYFKVEKKD